MKNGIYTLRDKTFSQISSVHTNITMETFFWKHENMKHAMIQCNSKNFKYWKMSSYVVSKQKSISLGLHNHQGFRVFSFVWCSLHCVFLSFRFEINSTKNIENVGC